jgi:hypothetical protein
MPGVKFSQFVFGGPPVVGDVVVGIRNGINTQFDFSAFNGSALTITVNQVGHGLVLNQVVRMNGANYVPALADNDADSSAVGIVVNVVNANQFVLQMGGQITTLVGLVPGNVYYLSDLVAGNFTNIFPIVVGHIRKTLFIANSVTSGIWLNYPGLVI